MISMANLEDNSASVASGNCPTFGYTLILLWFYLFIMINMLYLSSVRIVLTLVALIGDMSFLHMLNLVVQSQQDESVPKGAGPNTPLLIPCRTRELGVRLQRQ
jgi:hypothetical protein